MPLRLLALLACLHPASAHALRVEIESLVVTGNLEFADDFEDGERTLPPTDALRPLPNEALALVIGSQEEAGGALVLEDPFLDLTWLDERAVDDDVGTTVATWMLRAPQLGEGESFFAGFGSGSVPVLTGLAPANAGFVLEGQAGGGFVLTLNLPGGGSTGQPGGIGALLGNSTDWESVFAAGFSPSLLAGGLGLQVEVDHAADTAIGRYSLDGGASWITPAAARPTSGDQGLSFGAVRVVPEPGLAVLAMIGLTGAAGVRRYSSQ